MNYVNERSDKKKNLYPPGFYLLVARVVRGRKTIIKKKKLLKKHKCDRKERKRRDRADRGRGVLGRGRRVAILTRLGRPSWEREVYTRTPHRRGNQLSGYPREERSRQRE